MPKQNPKHQKKPIKAEYVRKRKKIPFQKRQILGIIFIGVFIVSMASIVVISYMNQNLLYVEAGDTVHVKYTLWTTQSNQNWNKGELKDSSDNIEGGIFIVEMKESASETGLIKGFYEALLNQVNGSIQHQVFL
ncbi:MAG: hypothetical protein GY870_11975, partial [archaeon]|nr:hypothetical protein [archaeon]